MFKLKLYLLIVMHRFSRALAEFFHDRISIERQMFAGYIYDPDITDQSK